MTARLDVCGHEALFGKTSRQSESRTEIDIAECVLLFAGYSGRSYFHRFISLDACTWKSNKFEERKQDCLVNPEVRASA